MSEIVNLPIVVTADAAIAAAKSVFSDTRILWDVINANSGQLAKDLIGMAPTSGKKIIVKIGGRSIVAIEQDRHGQELLVSRPLGSVGAACADLKFLMKGEDDVFLN